MSHPTLPTSLLLTFGLALGSCRRPTERPGAGRSPDSEAAPLPEPGRAAVVESSRALFVEGVISSVAHDRASIRLTSTGETVEAPLGEVYLPDTAATPSGQAATREHFDGSEARYAVCHMPGGRWRGCRVDRLGTRALVVDDDALGAELDLGELLVPTAITELNIRQRFDRNAKRRAFREGARQAGTPRIPSHWQPTPREHIVARRDGAWVAAEVKQRSRSSVRVQWASDARASDVPLAEVAPEPPIEFAPTVGMYVLVRPASGARTWSVMRVESTASTSLVVSDELGDTHDVALRDVVPLEHGAGNER